MSLILEALRKSEAERRRGQTPDLLSDATPLAPAAREATRNAGVMAAVGAAALLTLLLVAWWLAPEAKPEADAALAGVTSTDSTAAASTAPAAPTRAQSAAAPSVPMAVATIPAAAATAPPAALSPSPAPPSPEPLAAKTTTPDSTPQPTPSAPTPLPPPAAVASAAPSAALPAGATAQPAFTSPDAPLRLADLAADERQQLPTLKVSMHMWDSDPASRFAIIDGTRVNEGDRVGDATVQAIQQDGVLLAWRGRSIRLPIR